MLNQIKKKIDAIDLKWKIGGLVGLAAIAGILYFQFGRSHKTPKTNQKVDVKPRPSAKPEQEADQSPEKCLIRVINKVKKSFGEKGKIEYETIKSIYLGQYELSRKEFIQLALRHRTERRKAISDITRYRQLSKKYDQSLEELHNKHLNAILAHLRIEKEGWMDIIEEVSASNKEEWETLLNEAQNDELSNLRFKDKPKVGRDILVNIYKLKARFLKDNADTYNAITDIQPADLCSLVEKVLQDKVYEQFKVEEEDIKFSEKQLTQAETEDLERYEEEYLDVFRGLILKVEDDEEDDDEQHSAELVRRDQDQDEE